ncbi:MAG: type II toxin-antitoxin system RelE/ParE family toxin [Bacteroidales bacterium]|jgi:proteic killer suppression protein|nr:type II toxin-antitoxin system RelE/ParE family toxin [Bacteroidales bacterium]MCI2133022.1 type II toxin-antitoxin system RelE/ParE family toxin [Bacteroidales bacterium]
MIVEFEKEYLLDLYEHGKSNDKHHRFQPEVIRGYIKAINLLKTAPQLESLYPIRSLNFEALRGEKEGLCSVRANGKYRIEFTAHTTEFGDDKVTVCNIFELTNHYN